jgi:hypothetical protein
MTSANHEPRWVYFVISLAVVAFDAHCARAQSAPPPPVLQGGVQQNVPSGDVISGGDSGPSTTNQPGVGSSPACRTRDPECGGTNRECYNEAYHSTAIVMSLQQSQRLYQQTGGGIWIRCGACGANVICWPRPGYQDLISGRGSSGQSGQTSAPSGGPGQSGPSATPMDDTMRNVVASCAMIKQQQGSLVSRPSCLNDSVTRWCRTFQDKYPGCAAILADSGTHDPNQPISDGGYQSQQPSQAGGSQGISGQKPLQGGIKSDIRIPKGMQGFLINEGQGKQPKLCYYDPQKPYYNSPNIPEYKSAVANFHGVATIDLGNKGLYTASGVFDPNRALGNLAPGAAKMRGTITPVCDSNGLVTSLQLTLAGSPFPLALTPSAYNAAIGL